MHRSLSDLEVSYDRFMFLVLSATGNDVERVMVNGKTIVENGRVLQVDMPSIQACSACSSGPPDCLPRRPR